MLFSSLLFTFFFLPIVLYLYFLAKDTYHNYILLAASLLFYAYGEPKFVFVMAGSICINYGLAIAIHCQKEKKKKQGILFSTPIMKWLADWIDKDKKAGIVRAILTPICYAIIFLWAVSFLVLGAHNPFIYFNF